MSDRDNAFFDRADAFIQLANKQMSEGVDAGQVSASFSYGLARYSAWFCASGWRSSEDMSDAKEETVDFFVSEFRRMLELNMQDYIQNFAAYVEASQQIKNQN